jgi:hypothetical protein
MFLTSILAVPAASAAVGPVQSPFSGSADTDPQPDQAERATRLAIRREARTQQRTAIRRAKRKAEPAIAVPPQLEAIAQCESHGDPRAIGGGGTFRGKYQFTYATWAGVGGTGDPAAAPEAEQDMRAAMLYARSGPGQWPVCGA